MFFHVWRAINHTGILALCFFGEFLFHTGSDWKVNGPQANITAYPLRAYMVEW